MGVIEGAKTSPVPLETEKSNAAPKINTKGNEAEKQIKTIAGTSFSGSGGRLVLGEQFTAIKEAMANGGKYILVHPEVANKLQQAGMDAYIVHITALIMEMEAKIPRIEFFQADVEKLAQEWSSKPLDQAPMYVRQLLWLKANAEKYGYRQSGNSWKLKGSLGISVVDSRIWGCKRAYARLHPQIRPLSRQILKNQLK